MRKVENVKEMCDFARSLLILDSRIRINEDAFLDDKFFFVTKQHIYVPHGIPSIEHEIAHAVEMRNKDRWLLPDWGLAFGTKWNDNITPRIMFASMAREIRVRAIQLHMFPDKLNDAQSTAVNILNNEYAWGHWARMMVPFGRFRCYQDVWDWAADLREKTYKAWSLERIAHEWKIRLTHMQEWMETT